MRTKKNVNVDSSGKRLNFNPSLNEDLETIQAKSKDKKTKDSTPTTRDAIRTNSNTNANTARLGQQRHSSV